VSAERRSGGRSTAQSTASFLTPEQAVKKIMQNYSLNHMSNSEMFLKNAAEALERFPPDALHRLSSPVSGIVTKCKFPPTISEMVAEADRYMRPTSKNFV
jgi:hypothetical protein